MDRWWLSLKTFVPRCLNRKLKTQSFNGLHHRVELLLFQWACRTSVVRGKDATCHWFLLNQTPAVASPVLRCCPNATIPTPPSPHHTMEACMREKRHENMRRSVRAQPTTRPKCRQQTTSEIFRDAGFRETPNKTLIGYDRY